MSDLFDRKVTDKNREQVFAVAMALVGFDLCRDFFKIHVTCLHCGHKNWGTGWSIENLHVIRAHTPLHRFECSVCRMKTKNIDWLAEIPTHG